MEWIEVVGKTIEEATDSAAEQLGVKARELEIEIIEEPKSGLFGRTKGEARIRARIKPRKPRMRRQARPTEKRSSQTKGQFKERSLKKRGSPTNRPQRRVQVQKEKKPPVLWNTIDQEVVEEVKKMGTSFLTGLAQAFGTEGNVEVVGRDGESIEFFLDGASLGLLVGHGGATLLAVQELMRAIVKQSFDDPVGRVDVDIARYRERRTRALEEFAQKVAKEVVESGKPKALEPMTPPDRKVIHHALANFPGIQTSSRGNDPFRYVIIAPSSNLTSS